jgi:pyruvate kinase
MQYTKMIFTLGPATDRPDVLRKLIQSGMDCVRLNFSHGTHAEHARRFRQVKQEAKRLGQPIAVLMDLTGPKLRVGQFEKGEIRLAQQTEVRITPQNIQGTDGIIPITYKKLASEIRVGDPILLDDGLIRLKVVRKEKLDVICRVVTGGLLSNRKGMNLPGIAVSAPALTSKDRKDLQFGLSLGVDFVALSFVRQAKEMQVLRRLIRKAGSSAACIAKIEKPQAIPRLEAIIQASDGIMIARGDLGVEMNPEQVPVLQKRIITTANQFGRFVITATQMLQSMMDAPTPTRAEATDVANAIFDGTDAIMLSGETAAGLYPSQSAEMMSRITSSAEKAPEYNRLYLQPVLQNSEDKVVAAGVKLAEQLKAKALVVFTQTGKTARLVSRQRPQVPVIALAHTEEVQRQLQLNWGVESLLIKSHPAMEAVVEKAQKILLEQKCVKRGDTIVILASSPKGTKTNFIKAHSIGLK